MKFLLALLLFLAACGGREAEDAVAATLSDPSAARFQSVVRHGEAVCGEVNAGGAGGYRRFIYERGRATIAPGATYSASDLVQFDSTCRMLGDAGSPFDRQACVRAADARQDAERAAAFDRRWREACRN